MGITTLVKTKISGIAKVNIMISGGGSMKLDLILVSCIGDSHIFIIIKKLIIIYTSLIIIIIIQQIKDTDNDTIIKHNNKQHTRETRIKFICY